MRPILALTLLLFLLLAGCTPAVESGQLGNPVTAVTATPKTVPSLTPETSGPREISGVVLSGGDQSPAGLQDAPRIYSYEVKTGEGETLTVTYTAFPPSPAGDRQQIELDFHAGTVQVGDFLVASGTFDPSTATLTVAEEGDFIHTYLEKP